MGISVMLDKGAKMPQKAHETDAGYDLFAVGDYVVPAHGRTWIETGVHIAIPVGYYGAVTSKSGLMGKKGLTCEGTIDSDYRGSIKAIVFNHTDEDYEFKDGDKVTQLIICAHNMDELIEVDSLDDTGRGAGGFGSTGR